MKKEFQKFVHYIKEHKLAILALFIVSFFTYGFKLFHYSISIDTEMFLSIPKQVMKSWVGLGRPVLVFLKYLAGFQVLNPTVAVSITFLFFTCFPIFLYYLLYRNLKERNPLKLFMFGSIILTSIIYIEQLGFTLQSAEISIILNIFCFSILFFQKGMEEKNKWYYFFSFLCLTFSFGAYQSFVPFFITMISFLAFIEVKEKKLNFQKTFSFVLPAIIIFVLSLGGYFIGSKVCNLFIKSSATSYLSEQIKWGSESIFQTISYIFQIMKESYMGVFYGKELFSGFLFFFMILIVIIYIIRTILKKEKYLFWQILLLGITLITPFALTILLGTKEAYRAQLALPVLTACLLVTLPKEFSFKKQYTWMIVILFVALFRQWSLTAEVLSSDYHRYLEDEKYAAEIYHVLSNYDIQNKRVVMLGSHTPESILIQRKGETLGYSFFEWDRNYITGVGERASMFMQTLGYPIKTNLIEDYSKALNYNSMLEAYPNPNCVLELEDIIILKISN